MNKLIQIDDLWKGVDPAEYYFIERLEEILKNTPTVDAEPVKHGHWYVDGGCAYCSNCKNNFKKQIMNHAKYCPICGAKMDEVEDEWQEPDINPCRGCDDYDGQGGCKSNGGCGAKMDEVM